MTPKPQASSAVDYRKVATACVERYKSGALGNHEGEKLFEALCAAIADNDALKDRVNVLEAKIAVYRRTP